MIFRPRQMMYTETMPQDDIGVFDRPVLGGPRRQTILARRLVHELAGRVALIRVIGRHPKLVLHESSPLTRRAIRVGKRLQRGAGLELISSWGTNPVGSIGVRYPPVAHPGEV